jgi:hypothetical protein
MSLSLSLLLLLLLLSCSCFAAIEFELHRAVSQTLPVNLPSATVSSNTNKAAVPAGFLNLGVYYIDLSLGSQNVTAKAVIDTGSGLIHLPCNAVSGWTGESHVV